MKELFAELYNKVMTFFQTEKNSENSKNVASNRLKLVLMHDRTKLDPLTLEKMRKEMVEVISKYVVIDKELLELNLAGEGDSIALMLNIPVVRAKTEEELEEQRKIEEESNQDEETLTETTEEEADAQVETSNDENDKNDEESEVVENLEEKTDDVENEEDEEAKENSSDSIDEETESVDKKSEAENVEEDEETQKIEEPKKESTKHNKRKNK